MKKIMLMLAFVTAANCLMAQPNTLTSKERKDGWQLLFDGKTTAGWHNYLTPATAGPAWSVIEGTLQLDPAAKEGQADILTNKEYENFELSLDWNISTEGNSGIIFLVHEDAAYDHTYLTGPEYQLLDDKGADDNKKPNHLAGSLYDIITPTKYAENLAGQWNHSVIKLQNGELTFWLNGAEVIQTKMWDANWTELVSKSKFKDWKGFAAFHKGHIALQNHGYHIAFRNIKIKQL